MQVTGMEEHSHGYAALDQSHGNQKESLKPHQNKIKAGHLKHRHPNQDQHVQVLPYKRFEA